MKKSTFFICLILFFFSLSALFQTTEMFFIHDDFALIYKLQINKAFLYPYHNITTFYKPLYHIFGINAQSYFILSTVLYAISTIAVFFFFIEIVSKKIAIAASFLYGTGLIALENMIQVVYSDLAPTLVTIFAISLTLFIKYVKSKKIYYYFASILLFIFILLFFSHRAHLIYVYFFFVDFIFFTLKESFSVKKITIFAKRQAPFLSIYLLWLFFPRSLEHANIDIISLLKLIFSQNILNVPRNLTNLFIQPWQILFPSLIAFNLMQKAIIGTAIMFFYFLLIVFSWKKQKQIARIVSFSVITLLLNLIAYLFFNPEFQIEGISRYHIFLSISFSLLIASSVFLIKNLFRISAVGFLVIIFLLSFLLSFYAASVSYQKSLNEARSKHAKKFYVDLKRFLPEIPKDSIIYIDRKPSSDLPFDVPEFYRVGRLPTEAAFASMYKIPVEYLTFTENFNDIEKRLSKQPSYLDKVFSFYIDEKGLISTTQQLRALLKAKKTYTIPRISWQPSPSYQTKIMNCKNNYTIGMPPTFSASNLSLPSVVPVKIDITMQISPLDPSLITYPYYQLINPKSDAQFCDEILEVNLDNKKSSDASSIASYLIRQKELPLQLEVSSSPHLPEDPPQNLIDDDKRTLWTPNITDWTEKQKASIAIKSRSSIDVSRIVIVPANIQRLPTDFSLSVPSEDKKGWKLIRTIKNATMEEGKEYEVMFPPVKSNEFKLEITKSNKGLAPQLSSVYIVESKWNDIKFSAIEKFKKNPFASISDYNNFKSISSQMINLSEITIFWKKDKDYDFLPTNYIKLPVKVDGEMHTYSITIPAGGTRLEQLHLGGFTIPSIISIRDAQ